MADGAKGTRTGSKTIVFSDVDGTLLDSGHRIGSYTARAIAGLRERGVPFVIVSARGPSGIYPIFHRYGFRAPIISYSGALVLDEEGRMLFRCRSDGAPRPSLPPASSAPLPVSTNLPQAVTSLRGQVGRGGCVK